MAPEDEANSRGENRGISMRRKRYTPVAWDGCTFYTYPDGRKIPIEDALPVIRQVQSVIDQMEPEWRALLYEYGEPACDLWDRRTPMFATQKAMTAKEAAQILARNYGPPIQRRTA